MARTRIMVDLATGQKTERSYTPEEEAETDAAVAREQAAAADPASYPLTARQLRLGLVRNGITLSQVQEAIDSLPQPNRDEAQIYWEFSAVVNWRHPMTQALIAGAGINIEEAKAAWMKAKDYEA